MVCFAVGLLLCIGLWIAVPLNNFAFNNSFVSDGYLPEIVMLFIAILVLAVNPLLRLINPKLVLNHGHLCLICGMLLFAAVVPSNGLMRFFPHCIAYNNKQINEMPELATAIKNSDLPPELFPDPIGDALPTPVSTQMVEELEEGASIPWSAWVKPIIAWSVVILGFWIMMIGLGGIVFPQWRLNERLPFPLLKVYQSVLDDPEKGRYFPQVFRSPLFWAASGTVLFLHSLNGLNLVTGQAVPGFPISWDISQVFSSGVWEYAPGFLKQSKIYFLFVGLAYFMPNRYSFSIWFTVLFFGLVVMSSRMYFPSFNSGRLYDQGAGALLAMTAGILWLGRKHYLNVFKTSFRLSPLEEDKTNALAGRMFMLGCAIIMGWFIWAGAGAWSVLFVALAVMIMLLVARIVSETGITYVWIIPLTATSLISLFPTKWSTVASTFLGQAHNVLANRASAVSVAVMTILAIGMNRNSTPQSRRSLAGVGLFVLILGLFVAGTVHFMMGYTLEASLDGENAPITGRGARLMGIWSTNEFVTGRIVDVDGKLEYMILGLVIGVVLLILCTRFPNWPLHPIGLIFVHSSIGLRLCISLFVGWAIRGIIIHFFGARAYRGAMPVFLGLIIGEIFANALWTIIPLLQIWLGTNPAEVEHMIIFQYT